MLEDLADGSATLLICGMGTIQLKIGIHILEIENVLYVSRLDDTLFSITEHIKYKTVHLLEMTINTREMFQLFPFLQ